jgi:flagellin-like protein
LNNYLRKFKKNVRALSPVVASIILIAVTVAVSVAVAAWMGGMTIGFMGTSSVTVTNVDFSADDQITLLLKNTGTKTSTIAAVRINNQQVASANFNPDTTNYPTNTTLSLSAGDTLYVVLDGTLASWVNGNTYKIDLYDGSNQVIGSVQQNAPGA